MRLHALLLSLALMTTACAGSSSTETDDGSSGLVNEAGEELIDADRDGFYVNADVEADRDCNDNQPQIFPGQIERCNLVDDDCNRLVDDNAAEAIEYYRDQDGDGFGTIAEETVTACRQPPGYSANPRDCNDSDPLIYWQAQERCNELDDDCDTIIDDGLDFGGEWHVDRDRDGYGSAEVVATGCSLDPTWVLNGDDCNDLLDSVNPDADEICDGIDNDCDIAIDDADDDVTGARRYYADTDTDGFGDILNSRVACSQPDGHVVNALDCNDTDPLQSPNSVWYLDDDLDGAGDERFIWPREQCWQPIGYALIANDCNDRDAAVFDDTEWHPDADRDGYGGPQVVGTGCVSQPGWVVDASDCNDRDAAFSPDAEEVCDALDNDCDGLTDDADDPVIGAPTWFPDTDGDGYGVQIGSETVCTRPPNFVENSDDCNDAQASINPDTIWYRDADRDGYGNPDEAWPTPQCQFIPGYVNNTSDCDDSDFVLNDFTEWYRDSDEDGVGTGTTTIFTGCPPTNAYALDSGDCDDNDPANVEDTCFGPGVGLLEVVVSVDSDPLGTAVLIRCDSDPNAVELALTPQDANQSVTIQVPVPEGDTCSVVLFNVAGDPSSDGYTTVDISTCGDAVDSYTLDVTRQTPPDFEMGRCNGCYDPNASNYDPNVLVPTNDDSCIY